MQTKRIFLVTLLALAACRGRHGRTEVKNEEPAEAAVPRLVSVVKMSDSANQAQLLSGFYGIENGWRWTAGKFSVSLKSPLASAQRGALLSFSFSVPDVAIQKLGPITLTATAAGAGLGGETYSKPGPYTFQAHVPASALSGETVTIDFTLDKSLQPGPSEHRQLGVIAVSVGLEGK